jgi:hypothetical protein
VSWANPHHATAAGSSGSLDPSVARTGLEDNDRHSGALHRTLVYFGLADASDRSGAAALNHDTPGRLRALEQRVDTNTREINALREEIDRLRPG